MARRALLGLSGGSRRLHGAPDDGQSSRPGAARASAPTPRSRRKNRGRPRRRSPWTKSWTTTTPPAPASEGEIFAKYGIDSSGRAPTTAAVPEPEPPFTPLKDVPDDVQVAAEKILLGGGLLCLAVFVFIGGAITVDAFSVASGSPLEPGMKAFIVDVLEPKFTPTLIAGFACSISLGGLKRAAAHVRRRAVQRGGVRYIEEYD